MSTKPNNVLFYSIVICNVTLGLLSFFGAYIAKYKSFLWFYHWLVTSFFSIKFSFVFSLLDQQAMQHKSIQRISSIFSDDCDFFNQIWEHQQRKMNCSNVRFNEGKNNVFFYVCVSSFTFTIIIHFCLIF